MAALLGRTGQGPAGGTNNDIYTVLLIIATVFVLIATVLVAYQFGSYYGFEYLFRSAPAM